MVSTGEAARPVGVDRSTTRRWVNTGVLMPRKRTVGGRYRWDIRWDIYRWDIDDLEAQIKANDHQARREERPPFGPELVDAPRHPEEPT